MNRALWAKAARDSQLLLFWLTILLFAFNWLFVWFTSKIPLPAFADFLMNAMPKDWERISGVSFREVATPEGRIALAYVHPIVWLSMIAWAIGRGSDCVAGELGRGTMEILIAQPVRRSNVFLSQAVLTAAGAAVLSLVAWLGTLAGATTVKMDAPIEAAHFIPAAINLFALTFFVGAVAALVSSWEDYRWRAIGLVAGFFIVSMVLKVASRATPKLEWLGYLSFLTLFEPQAFVSRPEAAWSLVEYVDGSAHAGLLANDAILVLLGVACYAIGCIIFVRRDLPAPL